MDIGQVGHLFLTNRNSGTIAWYIRSSRRNRPARIPWVTALANPDRNRPDSLGVYLFNEYGDFNENPAAINGTEYGGLPEGMLLTRGGFLQGKPQEVGDFVFRIYAVDNQGNAGEATAWIPVSYDEEPLGFRPKNTPTALRILGANLPPVMDGNWKGTVAVSGGLKPYVFFVEGNYPQPNQVGDSFLDISSEGVVSHIIPEDLLLEYRGVWSFLIGVSDRNGDVHKIGVSVVIQSTLVAGVNPPPESDNSFRGTIPEGTYTEKIKERTFLILEAPVPVVSDTVTHSIFLGIGDGFHLNLASAPRDTKVTSLTTKSNGKLNPLREVGAINEPIHSGMVLEDNPILFSVDAFHQMFDRAIPLDAGDLPGEGEDAPILEGGSIDYMTPQAIRIRPLWPL